LNIPREVEVNRAKEEVVQWVRAKREDTPNLPTPHTARQNPFLAMSPNQSAL